MGSRMSQGAVFQRALRLIGRISIGRPPVIATLDAGARGPLQLSYELGHDAGLEREQLLDRAASVFLLFASVNLMDDLQDGDAGRYLDHPHRDGPAVQHLLQSLAFAVLAGAGVTPASLCYAGEQLVGLAAGQLDEVATDEWTGAQYRAVGERVAGDQYAAYVEIMWSGTPLQDRARQVGRAIGLVGHIAEDFRSEDPRLVLLPPAARDEIIVWAEEQRTVLREQALRSTTLAADSTLLPRAGNARD
jgi:hypothetical protein